MTFFAKDWHFLINMKVPTYSNCLCFTAFANQVVLIICNIYKVAFNYYLFLSPGTLKLFKENILLIFIITSVFTLFRPSFEHTAPEENIRVLFISWLFDFLCLLLVFLPLLSGRFCFRDLLGWVQLPTDVCVPTLFWLKLKSVWQPHCAASWGQLSVGPAVQAALFTKKQVIWFSSYINILFYPPSNVGINPSNVAPFGIDSLYGVYLFDRP